MRGHGLTFLLYPTMLALNYERTENRHDEHAYDGRSPNAIHYDLALSTASPRSADVLTECEDCRFFCGLFLWWSGGGGWWIRLLYTDRTDFGFTITRRIS